MKSDKVLVRALKHEGRQVGYVFRCPECGTEKPIPVAQFLTEGEKWKVPPQNDSELSGEGWWHLANDEQPHASAKGISFVLPGSSVPPYNKRAPQPINCVGGHGPYIIREGEVIEARKDLPIAFQ